MSDTRTKLIAGAADTLRDRGIAGLSARTIAAAAGVNQALIFYHFGTVEQLVDVACREVTAQRVARYADRFATVGSLGELLRLGRELHETERAAGNVTALAQVLAGAQQNPVFAATAAAALQLWVREIESAVRRILPATPLADLVDPAGVAHAVTASFIGIELYDGADAAAADAALETLERLTLLADIVDDLGPVGRRALRSRLRRATRTSGAQ